MHRIATLYLLLLFATISTVFADTYSEVLFENSVLPGNYMHSQVHYNGLSWVENVRSRLPVSDSVFFTPGNALSLKYTSSTQGDWYAKIFYSDQSRYYYPNEGDVLSFKVFVASNTTANMLPRLVLFQHDSLASQPINLGKYIADFQTDMWLNVYVPLKEVGGLRTNDSISGIQFIQGGTTDNGTHWLYIDQIEFLPATPPRVKLSSPAVLSTATAYDRHVDLTWQLPLTPSIRYIKIYRSEDNKHFEPVAIRPIFVQKCTDFVPYSNKTYYYKIAWVDYDYLESPFSNVLKAETKTASDEELLDFIQAAHFNYFLERAEVNSGMHATGFGIDDATVSVQETGLSILAHIVAAERGFISRSVVANRLGRILDFLGKVERYHGAFPAMIDGRTGKGVFTIDSLPEADVKATAFLMQGLLTAQQYFQTDDNQPTSLIEKIDTIWRGIAWNQFTINGQENILLDKWSPVTGFKYARPLGGFNDDFIAYVMALASPQQALPSGAYEQGLGVSRELLADSIQVMELVDNQLFSVKIQHDHDTLLPRYLELPYTNDTTLYGLDITLGSIDTPLLEAYKPFLAFDPRNKRDRFANYCSNNVNLTKAYQRRDNEYGGGLSLDIWGWKEPSDTLDRSMVINPAIVSASYGYLPDDAVRSIRVLYNDYGSTLFTEYGFRKWISIADHAVADEYDSENQAAVVVMIENGRSGLIWDLFSNHPAIQKVVENHFITE